MIDVKNKSKSNKSFIDFQNPRKKRKKIAVFDEDKRREFLTGFRKRNLERKKRAKEKFEAELKEEKKRLKQEARERYRKLLHKRPEINIDEFIKKNEYETDNHKISILELDVSSLDKGYIGPNQVQYEEEEEEEEEEKASNEEEEESDDSEISGFEVEKKKKNRGEQLKNSLAADQLNKQELKKTLKNAALKQLQKSKAYKKKINIERNKNKKKSKREKLKKAKLENKKTKGKKGKKSN